MTMIPVDSSAISAIGYDPGTKRMKVRFKQGKVYDFCGVPESRFNSFLNSASKGSYYRDYIKDNYNCY